MPDIISIGECFIEFIKPQNPNSPYGKTFSGDALNVLTMGSLLGSHCGFISRVSDDPIGDFLIKSWNELGIDTSHVQQCRGFNALEIYSENSVIGMYRSNSVASTINKKDIDEEYIKQSKILHISGISQGISQSCKTAVLEAVKLAKSHNLLVSYDPNFRPYLWEHASDAKYAMEEILEYTDMIFPSHPGDTETLLGITDPDDVYDYFKKWHIPTVILKCGEKGAVAYVENKKYTMSSIAPYGIIDVVGAGDTFVGTYLHCINNNIEIKEALKWSTTAAGIKIGGRSITSQPESIEIQKHLSKVIIEQGGIDA